MNVMKLLEVRYRSIKDIPELNDAYGEFSGTTFKGSVYLTDQPIQTLIGSPSVVHGNYSCSNTKISSLEGAPRKVIGSFYCSDTRITSLAGAPAYIGKTFFCDDSSLSSLHNVHKQIQYIGNAFVCNTASSHCLGLMFIKNLQQVLLNDKNVAAIINKHLHMLERDVHACQEELIDAGFPQYAKL